MLFRYLTREASWKRSIWRCLHGVSSNNTINTSIHQYRIISLIIPRTYFGHTIAVKVLREAQSEDQEIYITREINIQKMIDHPNCLRLHGLCENPDGCKVLLMDCVGPTLSQCLFSRKLSVAFSPSEKRDILLKLATAIAYLHAHNIVHRDLKVNARFTSDSPIMFYTYSTANYCLY